MKLLRNREESRQRPVTTDNDHDLRSEGSEGPIWETFRLYNLTADPTESTDLAGIMPDVVQSLRAKLEAYDATMIPPNSEPDVEEGNPNLYGGVWTTGWCDSRP